MSKHSMDLSAPAMSMLSILRRMMAFTISAKTKVSTMEKAKLRGDIIGLKYIMSTFIAFMTNAWNTTPSSRPNSPPMPVSTRFSLKT